MIHTRKGRVALGLTVAVTLVATLALTFGASADAPPAATSAASTMHMHMRASGDHAKRVAFHDHMRKLWEDHITWTRLFIVSFTADLPDLHATTKRLLANQVDIGDAVRPFYGDKAADELTKLLTKHITTAADLLAAAKANDTSAFNTAKDAWYRNARHIARFLHEANPHNWPLDDLRTMMRDHLDLTLQEASDHLTGHYAKDVADYDAVHHEILEMADMLSSGIIAQFPGRFS